MVMDHFMKAAFDEALSVDHHAVRPNPRVGAVVVSKEGEIIGKGSHQAYGKNHAEVNAIENALKISADLSDCVLYVTLEPCSHVGKTPPCTSLIIKHKFKKVVIGSLDPNQLVNGVAVLRENGIEVEVFEYPQLLELNAEFFVNKQFDRPLTVLKMAMTIDGKIADRNGNSKWLSNEKSRNHVHEKLRMEADAILTTAETIIKDDASFNIREKGVEVIDKDVFVLDRHCRLLDSINKDLKIFLSHPNSIIKLIGDHHGKMILNKNVQVFQPSYLSNGEINLHDLLSKILLNGYYSILIEAGKKLATSLLVHNLIDELHIFIVPGVLSDENALSIFGQESFIGIDTMRKFRLLNIQQFNDDVLLIYKCNT